MSKKSRHPISIRLNEEVAEMFREYSQEYATSQGEFVEIMLKRFDDTKDLYPTTNNETSIDKNIWIYTGYLNLYNTNKNEQYRAMKKYLVLGYSEYFYPDTNLYLPFNSNYYNCYEELKKEFNIQKDISNCEFCYWFWILWDNNHRKYLLVEKISLIEEKHKNTKLLKLHVDRARHFSTINDIRNQIVKFSMPEQLIKFDRQYAKEISAEDLKDYWY